MVEKHEVQLETKIKWLHFEVKKSEVKVTAKFSGEGISIEGLPSTTV